MIVGFGNAFYLLSQVDVDDSNDESASFNTAWHSFISLFEAMIGNSDFTLFEGWGLQTLCLIIYMVYIAFQSIVMLNMMIAIMGDSYERVQQGAIGQWRLELSKIILEMEQILCDVLPEKTLQKWQPHWLHVLSIEGSDANEGDEWAGRVKAITKEVAMNRETTGSLEGKVACLDVKVSALQESVAEMLTLLKTRSQS